MVSIEVFITTWAGLGRFSGTAQPCRPSLSNKADYLADTWHLHFSTTEITADLIDTSLSEVSCFFFRTFHDLHCEAKKSHPYYFFNNFVRPHNIFIIFGTQIL